MLRPSQLSTLIAAQYVQHLHSLSGLLFSSALSSDLSKAVTVKQLEKVIIERVKSAASDLIQSVNQTAQRYSKSAYSSGEGLSTEKQKAVNAHISSLIDIAASKIQKQFAQDGSQALKWLKERHFQSIVEPHKPIKSINFGYSDTLGRRWSSDRYIRNLTAELFLDAFNETTLLIGSMQKINVFQIDSAKSELNGLAIAAHGDSSLPIYADAKSKWFHPLSDNFLRLL